jgi:GAF domain-containing protein
MAEESNDRPTTLRSWLQTRLAAARRALEELGDLDPNLREPGFLGSVPYILVLRYLITFAVALRFYVHRPEYSDLEWFHRLLIIIAFVVICGFATYAAFRPTLRRSLRIQGTLIIVDVFLISAAYWLTGQYGSDFFLFYYLPIFSSVEHLGGKSAVALCLGVGVAMLLVAASLHTIIMPLSLQALGVLRVVFLRWFFLLAIGLTSALVFRALSQRESELSQRQTELQALLNAVHAGASAIPRVQELDEILESILLELTNKLKFDVAAISLVDEYRNYIETVRGRNISPGWILRARRSLEDEDIQTFVVKTKETKIIEGPDVLDRTIYPDRLLDPTIWNRFEHWRLVRIWVPIITSKGVVVGTIEAGCNRERRSEVFTKETIANVESLGRCYGDAISEKRPHMVLQELAKNVIDFIGAQSATLHVYKHSTVEPPSENGYGWGDLILATGAGEATPEFVRMDKPRPEGRGSKAIKTGEPEVVHPEDFESEYPELYKLGIRALAVVPLKLGSDVVGVLGIHFWHEGKTLRPREISLAKMIAGEMEGVIQDYLLLRRVTEEGARAWALSGLEKLMQSLTSPFSLTDVLKEIARNALQTLDADNVVVYQYRTQEEKFLVPPVADGEFIRPVSRKLEVQKDDMLHELAQANSSTFVIDVLSHPLLTAEINARYLEFAKRENIKSCAALVLRAGNDHEIVGLLFLNFRKRHVFIAEEKRAMDTFANAAALAIRNARLHKDDLNNQLAAISKVHDAIADKRDLSPVLQQLLEQTLVLTGAKYGICLRWNERDRFLERIAGIPSELSIKPFPLGEGIAGLAARSRKSILVEDVEDLKKTIFVEDIGEITPAAVYKKVHPDTRCEIAVPLVDGGELLGVLNIEHPQAGAFSQDDRVLLKTLAVPAIIAFRTIQLYENLERRIRHQKALNLIAGRVQKHADNPETIVRLFLTGITAGGGLGFSRVMLFLPDEQHQYLRGKSAIGPITAEQAREVWEALERNNRGAADNFEALLSEVETTCYLSPLNQEIRRIRVPIDDSGGAVARALSERTLQIVSFDESDPFRLTLALLTEPSDVQHAFAAIPLIGLHEDKIGVLFVDNRFLWKERAIDREDIEGLEAFASRLAMSIENAHLQQELTERQKLENWQEVTGAIAHTMGTLLFGVRGDLRELSLSLTSTNEAVCSKLKPCLEELGHGLGGLERVLVEFKTFAHLPALKLQTIDLRELVRNVFLSALGGPEVKLSLPETPLLISVDAFQLGNALREIKKNAQEAMGTVDNAHHLITVTARRATLDVHREHAIPFSADSAQYIELIIEDNGPGFSPEIASRVFEPYVTTKDEGSGLGLAIVKKIVTAHAGKIDASSSSKGGAVFRFQIPAAQGMPDERRFAVSGTTQ